MVNFNRIMPYVFPLFVGGILLLYSLYNPLQCNFPLRCPWNLLTGTQCPACGFQRALYALLHGDIWNAIRYNYFFVFSIPYALLAVLATWYNYRHAFDRLRIIIYHRYTLRAYIVMYLGWWIVRNLYEI